MTQYRKFTLGLSVAMAITLTACGGGGGAGGIASAPPPPPTPTPTPAAVVSAPALAMAPNASMFPDATAAGPTLQTQPMTVFPLLQTAVSIGSGQVKADTATMNGGATLAFDSIAANANDDSYRFNVGNATLGVSDHLLSYQPAPGTYGASLASGKTVTLERFNLSWTTFGSWAVSMSDGTRTEAVFVTGYETPTGSVPATGTATYHGFTSGKTYHPQAGEAQGVASWDLAGKATLEANFASGIVTGNLTMESNADWYDMVPWNSVSLLGAISGGQFTGTSTATSAPNNIAALSGSATGTFVGMFFGPNAQELGAVWTLYDGTASAIGSIGASTDSCAGCWDY